MNTAPKSPRARLSPDRIVAVAVTLADGEGLEALSMRKLAAKLGISAMAIYNHVAGKEALIDMMLDHIAAEIEPPAQGADWRCAMAQRARSVRQMLLRHSWAAPLFMSRIAMGEALMRDGEASLACLIRAGFTYRQADWARNAIDSHIYGYTIQELNFPVDPDQYRAAAAEHLPQIPQDRYPFAHGAAVAIIDGSYDGLTQFDFGLGLILDGIARWIAADGPGANSGAP